MTPTRPPLNQPMQPDKPTFGSAEFDAYSNNYDSEVNKAIGFSGLSVDFFTRVKADYLLDLVSAERGAASSASLLDVGCGVGNYHRLLSDKVQKLVGVDVSTACLETARDRNPAVAYHAFDGRSLPLDETQFDGAFAICVFHHVARDDRLALTKDIRRVLKRGAFFAIFEHNPFNPLTMRVVNSCEFDRDAVLLKSAEAEGLMRSAGFTDVKSRFILNIPAAGRLLRMIDRLGSRIPLGAQYYTFGRA